MADHNPTTQREKSKPMTNSVGGRLSLIHGNSLAIPLADQSVHLICTSPPYFALRAYADGGETYDGQLGSEETPHHFLAALWVVMDECWRVLRDDGSCWVNLGDKFSGAGPQSNGISSKSTLSGNGHKGGVSKTGEANKVKSTERYLPSTGNSKHWGQVNPKNSGVRAKSRMLLPHRFALGMIDPDYRAFEEARAGLTPTVGAPQWICRMDAVWSKLNGLPESVTDRVRASHEYWLHFVKSERYFAAMDEIREESEHRPGGMSWEERKARGDALRQGEQRGTFLRAGMETNPLGKLPGSVWSVAMEPLSIPDHLPQHFAAFPSTFPKRIVLGWSPSGVCVWCGQPRRPGACISDTPTRPAVVCDPFSGTGTTAIVAAALGRHGVGVDLSWDYHRIARWRDGDGGLRAKALGVERPAKELDGQLSLLDGAA